MLLLLVGPVRAQSSDKLPEPVGRSITVTDFPMPGETVTLEWQQNSQNFVITAVE